MFDSQDEQKYVTSLYILFYFIFTFVNQNF